MTLDSKKVLRIQLTGDRLRGRYVVLIGGEPVRLTASTFCTLCTLAIAQDGSRSGYCQATPYDISRLRKELAQVAPALWDVVQTGSAQEYRLNREVCEVTIDPSVTELSELRVLSDRQVSELCQLRSATA